jgi:hypothetical protein
VSGQSGAEDDLALHMRQRSHVGEGVTQGKPTAEIGLDGGGLGGGDAVQVDSQVCAIAGGVASEINGSVVGDAVEPRAQLTYIGAAAQG